MQIINELNTVLQINADKEFSSPQVRGLLLQKYNEIAASVKDKTLVNKVENNMVNFKTLLNYYVVASVLQSTPYEQLKEYKELYAIYKAEKDKANGASVRAYGNTQKALIKILGNDFEAVQCASLADIKNSIATLDIEFDELEGDEGIDELEGDDEFSEIFDDEQSNESEQPDTDKGFIEKRDKILKSSYSLQITNICRNLGNFFADLYGPAFTGLGYVGILTEPGVISSGKMTSPILKLNSSVFKPEFKNIDEASSYDSNIVDALKAVLPKAFTSIVSQDSAEIVPDTNTIMGSDGVATELHLAFETACIKYAKGLISIRKWVKETKNQSIDDWVKVHNAGNANRLLKTQDIYDWYKWALQNIFCKCLIDNGFNCESTQESEKIQYVSNRLLNLKNVIVLMTRDKGVKTEITIAQSNIGDEKAKSELLNRIVNQLKLKIDDELQVDNIANRRTDMITLSIVFDKQKANKPSLFAGDVLNNIIESGNVPSWSHVLLGKQSDGKLLFWDKFMEGQITSRCYSIYAGSGSGKGIMTSTILASALVDKKHIFYTDGKPENGAALGMIAWLEGKEAYVFDGQAKGSNPFAGDMENYTYGVRANDRRMQTEFGSQSSTELREALFENDKYFSNDTLNAFLGVMRYIKSLALCISMCNARGSGVLPCSEDNWQVWVFDEMTAMAQNEKKIRDIFGRYVQDKGIKKLEVTSLNTAMQKNQDLQSDAGLVYIKNWLDFCDNIKNVCTQVIKISIRKADMDIICIFQEANWLQKDSEFSDTLIYAFAKQLPSTKIAGKGGIQNGCGTFGDGARDSIKRLTQKLNAGSKWAISKGEDIRAADENGECIAEVFKPFNIWTVPMTDNNELMSDGATTSKGFVVQNGVSAEDTRYLYGYVHNVFRMTGGSPADVLNAAFVYADEAVKTLGFAGSLKEYLYDLNNLGNSAMEVSFKAVQKESEQIASDDTQVSRYNTEDENEKAQGQVGVDAQSVTNRDIELYFMKAKVLSEKRFEDEQLIAYINKFGITRRLLKQNSFDLKDRATTSTKGLMIAAVLLSTLHYVCQVRKLDNLEKYKAYFTEQISAGGDLNNTFKVYLGMLADYDIRHLEYDEMPSIEKMQQYINNFISAESEWGRDDEDDWLSLGEISSDNGSISEEAMPDEVLNIAEPSFGIDKNGNTIIKPRNTQEVVIYPDSSCVSAEVPKYSVIGKFKKKLFESKNGVSYEFKKRWDYVLDAVEKVFPNKSLVTRVAIVGQNMSVNGKTLKLDLILGGDYDIRIEDILNIERLLKRFKFIQELILDANGLQQFIVEYGADIDGVIQVFEKHKVLKCIGFIPVGDGKPRIYTRAEVEGEHNKLEQQLKQEEMKMRIENVAARKNPRMHEKSVGYTNKFFNSSKKLAGTTFKKSLSLLTDKKNPKLIRASMVSIVGLGIIGVGSIIGLFGLAGRGISKLFNLGRV